MNRHYCYDKEECQSGKSQSRHHERSENRQSPEGTPSAHPPLLHCSARHGSDAKVYEAFKKPVVFNAYGTVSPSQAPGAGLDINFDVMAP
ncbi:MAG: hypothetical protein IIT43_01945, partial [Clostridia bacterium]|nr:hypothetical protein [Clostridia bacterium]